MTYSNSTISAFRQSLVFYSTSLTSVKDHQAYSQEDFTQNNTENKSLKDIIMLHLRPQKWNGQLGLIGLYPGIATAVIVGMEML